MHVRNSRVSRHEHDYIVDVGLEPGAPADQLELLRRHAELEEDGAEVFDRREDAVGIGQHPDALELELRRVQRDLGHREQVGLTVGVRAIP